MSAAMESILTGYDDPRLKVYFETCTDKAYVSHRREYRGIQGTCFAHNHYCRLIQIVVDQSTDAPLMSSAECLVLRAEVCFARMDSGG